MNLIFKPTNKIVRGLTINDRINIRAIQKQQAEVDEIYSEWEIDNALHPGWVEKNSAKYKAKIDEILRKTKVYCFHPSFLWTCLECGQGHQSCNCPTRMFCQECNKIVKVENYAQGNGYCGIIETFFLECKHYIFDNSGDTPVT